jgi:proteic killer suppression protein
MRSGRALDSAQIIEDMDIPGFRLHSLKGADRGRGSIRVNGNWRLTFEFRDGQAYGNRPVSTVSLAC